MALEMMPDIASGSALLRDRFLGDLCAADVLADDELRETSPRSGLGADQDEIEAGQESATVSKDNTADAALRAPPLDEDTESTLSDNSEVSPLHVDRRSAPYRRPSSRRIHHAAVELR